MEARARRSRYRALATAAEGRPILTAHTADDQAETVIYRLAKGAGLLGAGGIRPRTRLFGATILRPFLGVRRRDLEALVEFAGLPVVEDPTNGSRAFARNRLRLDVLPALEAAIPGATGGLARAAELARRDEAFLARRARRLGERLAAGGGIDLAALAVHDPALSSRILRDYIRGEVGKFPTSKAVGEVLALGHADGEIHIGGGWVARSRAGVLRIETGGRSPRRRGGEGAPENSIDDPWDGNPSRRGTKAGQGGFR